MIKPRKLIDRLTSGAVLGIPYIWLLLFFLVPFAIVFKISFAESVRAQPPVTPLIIWDSLEEIYSITLNFFSYIDLFEYDLYLDGYLNSLSIASTSAFICLIIGYPIAFVISKLPESTRNIALMLVILPSWTSFLIRIYAWLGLLKNNGLINNALMSLGIIDTPIHMLHTPFAVYLGIVYAYLPFMILPLYTNLVKHDHSLVEAASDLGASPIKTFFLVTLPLSLSGIVAGVMLVFIPAVGEFVIPELLGGPNTVMIGKLLWQEFFSARNWPGAAALAISMLMVLIIPIMIYQYVQAKEMEAKGNE
ncbi:putrescine transport system permease protein [Sinobacterium caligoides]|uniref:Putrescine transport system permease protein n=1 Tax=Sinobacterium caligoides TaxID=933926 RepID=A0A3N2DK91_9GAMM|nr:ABC transporter permease subunit [Sinobacterium caligoides]ROS00092.1 putrescine transport system permease protein [Sinobacterium caligoides]